MKVSHLRKALLSLAATALLAFSLPCAAEPVPFGKALDLALQHSGLLVISAASQRKAHDVYEQARAAYLPNIVFGSGLGYSAGIPPSLEGSAPSIFNVTSQQSLLNFAQRDFVRAAKNELQATHFDVADKRNAVILDTATSYLELDTALRKLKALSEAAQAANRAEFITTATAERGPRQPTRSEKSPAQHRQSEYAHGRGASYRRRRPPAPRPTHRPARRVDRDRRRFHPRAARRSGRTRNSPPVPPRIIPRCN